MLKYLKFDLILKSNFLESESPYENKWLNKSLENKKVPIFDESKFERQELSNDVLKTISNREFLKQPLEKRLQYITNPKVNYNSVSSWEVKNIIFTFTFDDKFNRDLYMHTTAWQVLPREVNKVKVWDRTYTRSWIAWEFFDWNSRLIIREWTRIEIPQVRSKEELKKIEKENIKSFSEFYRSNPNIDQTILQESISRWIDPKFAILAFWKTYEMTPENEKMIVLEDMMTYFDKYRWYFNLSKELKDGKYNEKLVLWILSKYNKEDWENRALEYWITREKIDDYKSNWEIYIWMHANDIKNWDSLPDWTYLKWDELLKNQEFKTKLSYVCDRIWARYDDMIKLMKAESWLDPRIINSQSWAIWLIQFMPNTAIWLWTSVWKIRAMTAVEQLDLVQKYFEKNSNWADLSNITKLYQVVFYPLSLNKNYDFVFGSEKSKNYAQKIALQNSWIARFSSRSDWLIDWYAFSRYVDYYVSKNV